CISHNGIMIRVLLALDDYSELVFNQTMLKKMGFDVVGVQTPHAVSENLLSFGPQVLVVSAHGKKINGIHLTQTIRRPRGFPKIFLVFHSHQASSAERKEAEGAVYEVALESPIDPKVLLQNIAEHTNLDAKQLLEKFEKVKAASKLNREGPGEG